MPVGERYINDFLSNKKNVSQEPQQRKVRSDKLHDIKIPVPEIVDTTIRKESRRAWNGSKTALGTDILTFGLEQIFVYPEVNYQDGPFTVHCKVDHETFQRIGDHAAEWKCSVRKAAHRIFMEAYKKRQLGGVTDGQI